ncbi:hypothetical protein [Streptomyces sp. NPDC047079]|uniref:hypothetical protein n=1 Tax=Streptomyces sp. NPDC047079 TaxID=3154607 RepID=UPI00340D96C1
MSTVSETAMAPSTPADQRDSDSARAERIERHVDRVMAALAATPDEQHAGLTPEQVCDLPMDELLTRVNGRLDSTEINEPGFFGYITVTASGRITIYTPASLHDDIRDAAIRYLITTHLGLPTHLFPDVFRVTVFAGPNLDEVQS